VNTGYQRGFFIPNVPKAVWERFQHFRKHYDLTQRQGFVLLVLMACKLAEETPEAVADIVAEVKAKIGGNPSVTQTPPPSAEPPAPAFP
jgi:hypothetical protein